MRECDTRMRFNFSSFVDKFFLQEITNRTHISSLKNNAKKTKVESALIRKNFMYNFKYSCKLHIELLHLLREKQNTNVKSALKRKHRKNCECCPGPLNHSQSKSKSLSL